MEPTGAVEDDPKVTGKKFPGNATRSYRTRGPVKVVGELGGWTGPSPDQLRAMGDGLANLKCRGLSAQATRFTSLWPAPRPPLDVQFLSKTIG